LRNESNLIESFKLLKILNSLQFVNYLIQTHSKFVLLKAFSVQTTYINTPKIKEVIWHPPILNRVKWNIDGASLGNPGPLSCEGIFRNSNADLLGAFAMNLGFSNSLCAELHGAMIAIETSFNRGWTQSLVRN